MGRREWMVVGLGELVVILELHRQGLSVSAIARRHGLDRKTVRKYLERGLEPPAYGPRQSRAAKVTPFADYLRGRRTQLWFEECRPKRSRQGWTCAPSSLSLTAWP